MTQFDKDIDTVMLVYGEVPDRHPDTTEWPIAKTKIALANQPFAWGLYCGANGKDHKWWRYGESRIPYIQGLRLGTRMRGAGL